MMYLKDCASRDQFFVNEREYKSNNEELPARVKKNYKDLATCVKEARAAIDAAGAADAMREWFNIRPTEMDRETVRHGEVKRLFCEWGNILDTDPVMLVARTLGRRACLEPKTWDLIQDEFEALESFSGSETNAQRTLIGLYSC